MKREIVGSEQSGRTPVSTAVLYLILIAALVAIFVVVGFYFASFSGPISQDPSTWAQFGDYVGGALNPILAFLALIALLITIAVQSKELKNSSQELGKSSAALEMQVEAMRKQEFEAAFFSLLRFQNAILQDIDILGRTGRLSESPSGRDCFRDFYNEFYKILAAHKCVETETGVVESYHAFYSRHEADVGHYFRHLYHIINFVDKSEVVNPEFYVKLVRAQLSSNELLLTFYNCLSPLGSIKFKGLVEKYSLLKNMPVDQLIDKKHLELYDARAYSSPHAVS